MKAKTRIIRPVVAAAMLFGTSIVAPGSASAETLSDAWPSVR